MQTKMKTVELATVPSEAGRKMRQKNIDKWKQELTNAEEALKNFDVGASDRPSSPLSDCPSEQEAPNASSRASTLRSTSNIESAQTSSSVQPAASPSVGADDLTAKDNVSAKASRSPTVSPVGVADKLTPTEEHFRTLKDKISPNNPGLLAATGAGEGHNIQTASPAKPDDTIPIAPIEEKGAEPVKSTISETEQRAWQVIAELDHAISGSSPNQQPQNDNVLSGGQIGSYINSMKSIWGPHLPRPPSPMTKTEVRPTYSAPGLTVGEESAHPGPATETLEGENSKHAELREDSASALSMKTVNTEDLVEGASQQIVEGAPPSSNESSGSVVPGVISMEIEGLALSTKTANTEDLVGGASRQIVEEAPPSTNEPSGSVVSGVIPTELEDPDLEELLALARVKGIEYLYVTPEMKTEEVQVLKQEGNETAPTILTKYENEGKAAGKRRAQMPSDSEESSEMLQRCKRSKPSKSGKQGERPSKQDSKKGKSKGKKAKKEEDDDDDFIVSDDEEVKGSKEYIDVTESEGDEPDRKPDRKPQTAEVKKDKCSWKVAARVAMTDKWQKKGRKACEKWCLDSVKNFIPASVRNKARTVSEYCPKLGTTCAKMSLEVLTSEIGTTRCLNHSFSRDWMQNDQIGSTRGFKATGIPHNAVSAKKKPEDGFLHCGCRIDTALMEFYFFKTGKITSEKRQEDGSPMEDPIVKSWCGTRMSPRQRVLVFKQMAEETAWSLDCVWTRKENKEGQWVVEISDIVRQKILISCQFERLKWLEARAEAERAKMNIDKE
ncbi:hypothetical protein GYMLUDRAFT_250401 [Collybiopsis luxurians FD-317 M1]|uniref:Uncharacterized protein n=1 Tax=Collybiopsis luxurians FD-317 M1 TaxID=944289 RepID=A0A0D0BV40_9AGAR|nr:hypothetical protein GYMLUDRAFT_250401 [Collybiopsis luxurians FD-317 M1]